MPPLIAARARRRWLLAGLLGLGGAALVVLTASGGCSYASSDSPGIGDRDTSIVDVGDAQVIEVGDDVATTRDKLCGEMLPGSCDPDRAEKCTRLDAGIDGGDAADGGGGDGGGGGDVADTGPADVADSVADAADTADAADGDAADEAGDADVGEDDGGESDAVIPDVGYDSAGSGTVRACRVVHETNQITTACAPAGTTPREELCLKDADCAPGLACVGTPGTPARCRPFCCGATPDVDPCHADGSYCTPVPLAERPADSVPVCVTPDRCHLLASPDTICTDPTTTCTVVTKYGDTSCVPVGHGRDLDCCSALAPCDRGYACLGPTGDRRCRKLCHEGHDEECTAGLCDKSPTIPAGFGVCIVADAGVGDSGTCGP